MAPTPAGTPFDPAARLAAGHQPDLAKRHLAQRLHPPRPGLRVELLCQRVDDRLVERQRMDRVAPAHGHNRTMSYCSGAVSYTHLRAHETVLDLVCRLLLEKK